MNQAIRTVHCPMCGTLEDVFVDLDSFYGASFACPTEGCEFRALAEIGMPMITGIQSASPEYSSQLNRTFHSNAEKRDYMKKHGIVEFSKGDATDRAYRDHARSRADAAARKMGHADEDARRAAVKKEQSKGWTPTPGDGKVKTTGGQTNA